jgi:hypothetical protein
MQELRLLDRDNAIVTTHRFVWQGEVYPLRYPLDPEDRAYTYLGLSIQRPLGRAAALLLAVLLAPALPWYQALMVLLPASYGAYLIATRWARFSQGVLGFLTPEPSVIHLTVADVGLARDIDQAIQKAMDLRCSSHLDARQRARQRAREEIAQLPMASR